jgi:hypothetical protein
MSSNDMTHMSHNLLITLVAIGLGILLINTILLVSHVKDSRRDRDDRENYVHTDMWDNGGVYNGIGVDSNPFQTKLACSCSGYGVKRNQNMPFDDDSNLYNSPLLHPQNIHQ